MNEKALEELKLLNDSKSELFQSLQKYLERLKYSKIPCLYVSKLCLNSLKLGLCNWVTFLEKPLEKK